MYSDKTVISSPLLFQQSDGALPPPYHDMIEGPPTIGIYLSQGILHSCEKTFGKKRE